MDDPCKKAVKLLEEATVILDSVDARKALLINGIIHTLLGAILGGEECLLELGDTCAQFSAQKISELTGGSGSVTLQ